MRIVIATWFPDDPMRPRGGVEAVSATLVRALVRVPGLDVSVFTFSRAAAVASQQSWEGAAIHRAPWPSGSMLRVALGAGTRQLAAFVERLQPDVLHAHDTFGIMSRRIDRPRVLTIHGFIHGDTRVGGGKRRFLRSLAWRQAEHRAWASFPNIISISPYVRERLAGIAPGRIVDIENPIDPVFFARQRREGPPVIFTAGVICRRKNPGALVEALALLRKRGSEVRLRIAGGTTEPAYLAALDTRVRDLGLERSVDLIGPCGVDAIASELEGATIFALVSREENAPLGIEEAMAVGVPVVASNRCGMPYQVRDGETGLLVDPEDPEDIAARCGELLRDEAFRHRAGAQARQQARDRFHPDAVSRLTARLYRRIAGVSG